MIHTVAKSTKMSHFVIYYVKDILNFRAKNDLGRFWPLTQGYVVFYLEIGSAPFTTHGARGAFSEYRTLNND